MGTIKRHPPDIRTTQCRHEPPCPRATDYDRLAAVVIAAHPEQGWSLLCNGVITFEDTGAIAGGEAVPPHRAAAHPSSVCAGIARAA